jgi:hypothetical protein
MNLNTSEEDKRYNYLVTVRTFAGGCSGFLCESTAIKQEKWNFKNPPIHFEVMRFSSILTLKP